MDPDPGGPKTYGSGSAALFTTQNSRDFREISTVAGIFCENDKGRVLSALDDYR